VQDSVGDPSEYQCFEELAQAEGLAVASRLDIEPRRMHDPMASPDFTAARLPAILARLIERTERGEVDWEAAAPPDSFAVTIGEVRFRIRSFDGDVAPPYVLEFLGQGPAPAPALMTGVDLGENLDSLLTRLYLVARESVIGSIPDPFVSVERALGLESPANEN
jgi:hypothetical protein